MTGKVTVIGSNWFTLQTAGRKVGVVNALTSEANRIAKDDFPYVWGGGHGEAGVASTGSKGPGYNGRTRGFDCSGSVAAVLSGAGLWAAGAGVPADNGVISELEARHVIAPGVGKGATEVTLYDNPGVHIFMNIDGRFFGTSDGAGGGNPKGGAGWLYDGAPDAARFKKYHVLPSVLHQHTTYGENYTFQMAGVERIDGLFAGALNTEMRVGEKVRVSYANEKTGALALKSLTAISGAPTLPTAPTTTTPTTTVPVTPAPTVTTPTVTTPTVTTPTVSTDPVTTDPGTTDTTGSGDGYYPSDPWSGGYGYGNGYGSYGSYGGYSGYGG